MYVVVEPDVDSHFIIVWYGRLDYYSVDYLTVAMRQIFSSFFVSAFGAVSAMRMAESD